MSALDKLRERELRLMLKTRIAAGMAPEKARNEAQALFPRCSAAEIDAAILAVTQGTAHDR